ncbi:MAG: hypothetical protein AAB906_00965 [Patescibacteria group bacterium]
MKKDHHIYFISGVCGVGKSSVLKHLRNILPSDKYEIHDFDERGVPDGGGQEWHDRETFHWLEIGKENAKKDKSTIICGFQNPERFRMLHKNDIHVPATLYLLHASADTLRKRLFGRYPTPESILEINRASGVPLDKFVEDNVSFAPELRLIFEKAGAPIIDTEMKTPEEVAKEIIGRIDSW